MCIEAPLIRVDAGGWCMNIAEHLRPALILDWLKLTMGHAKGFDLWYRSGVICACDLEVLIEYHSNPDVKCV